jgi:hypothetical protein
VADRDAAVARLTAQLVCTVRGNVAVSAAGFSTVHMWSCCDVARRIVIALWHNSQRSWCVLWCQCCSEYCVLINSAPHAMILWWWQTDREGVVAERDATVAQLTAQLADLQAQLVCTAVM